MFNYLVLLQKLNKESKPMPFFCSPFLSLVSFALMLGDCKGSSSVFWVYLLDSFHLLNSGVAGIFFGMVYQGP